MANCSYYDHLWATQRPCPYPAKYEFNVGIEGNSLVYFCEEHARQVIEGTYNVRLEDGRFGTLTWRKLK